MKKILGIILLVIVVIALGFVFTRKTESGVIQIGALLPLTGGLASYGEPAQKTVDMAIEEINANGGINGKKLEVVYGNHKCDPKEMVSAYESLVMRKINIFNTVACSGAVSAIAPGLVSKDVVLLGTAVSASKLTAVSPNFFRNWASDRAEAKVIADQIIKKGYKNIAVIYEETDYAKGLELDLESYLKGTDVKIVTESFSSISTDLRTQLTKLKNVKPDAMFTIAQTGNTGEIILTQMEQIKFTPKLFVNYNILKAAALLKGHTATLEGAIAGDYYIKDSVKLDKVLADYKLKYGVDCPQRNICAMEYDAIQMLAQAIKANGDSVQGVKDYLSKNTYAGVSGEVGFDSNNDRNNSQYVPFVIKSGVAVKVTE
jgi:branched-chain amino acid transport system substrate-binding protein